MVIIEHNSSNLSLPNNFTGKIYNKNAKAFKKIIKTIDIMVHRLFGTMAINIGILMIKLTLI